MNNFTKPLAAVCTMGLVLMTMLGAPAKAEENVRFNMAWLPQGSVAGPIVAAQQGWFKEAGLDVEISRGYGGSRTANEVDQGLFDIGYIDPIQVALNRKNGGHLRMVGVINGEWPAGICYVKSEPGDNRGFNDLMGLRMGGGSYSPVHNILPAWLKMNGKESNAISLLRLEPAVVDASLLEGRIDLAECWRGSNRAVLGKLAKQAGKDIGWVEYSDHGLNAYGSGFTTTEKMISERPKVLRAFLKAAYRGYAFALENPEKAADLLLAAYPSLDRDITLQQIQEMKSLIVSDGKLAAKFDPKKIDDTFNLVTSAFGVPADSMSADDLYTNSMVE